MTKNDRLDDWNAHKKQIDSLHPINQDLSFKPKFTIHSWSVWWYYIGENIGKEFGSHFDNTNAKLIHKRPCVIVSKRASLHDSKHYKVIVLPLSSIKTKSIEQSFHHILKNSNYPKLKDSFVLCNEIRTIDVRRLEKRVVDTLDQPDIDAIKKLMCNYIDFN